MSQIQNESSAGDIHQKLKTSTTKNRRDVTRTVIDVKRVNQRMEMRNAALQAQTQPARKTAQQIKETEIQKVLKSAASETKTKKKKQPKMSFGFKRVLLALGCAIIIVLAVVFLVNHSSGSDMQIRVAAMQNGIDARYPSFTPRGYTLSDITSEDGKITLTFKNSSENQKYILVEEKSSWDSNALEKNYVYENLNNYTEIQEQGLTIFVDSSNAAWVNGGILYKLKVQSGSLTKKQIKAIAVSL